MGSGGKFTVLRCLSIDLTLPRVEYAGCFWSSSGWAFLQSLTESRGIIHPATFNIYGWVSSITGLDPRNNGRPWKGMVIVMKANLAVTRDECRNQFARRIPIIDLRRFKEPRNLTRYLLSVDTKCAGRDGGWVKALIKMVKRLCKVLIIVQDTNYGRRIDSWILVSSTMKGQSNVSISFSYSWCVLFRFQQKRPTQTVGSAGSTIGKAWLLTLPL